VGGAIPDPTLDGRAAHPNPRTLDAPHPTIILRLRGDL
jgi:hypothetical protein